MKRVKIGESCENDAQCQGGSSCTDGSCQCPEGFEESDGICIKVRISSLINIYKHFLKKIQRPKNSLESSEPGPQPTFCPLADQAPYMEPRTKKLRFCSPSKKGSCPRLFTCQFSPSLKKNICCGRNSGPAGFIGLPGGGTDNGDNIITKINQIANIVSTGKITLEHVDPPSFNNKAFID